MEPWHRNSGAYCGERIHINEVLAAIIAAAALHGWKSQSLLHGKDAGGDLIALTRGAVSASRRVYISAGIHGDEPAGPMAVLRLLEEDAWPKDVSFFLCPCLNPLGFLRNTRENHNGVDLNRDYRSPKSAEIQSHTSWLSGQPRFDMGIHLHEDWESQGFYLFELNPKALPSRARQTVAAVSAVCPIDVADEIEEFKAVGGIIQPNVDPESRDEWPEAFFMVQEKTDISYTLEAPSDFPLPVRIAALQTAVKTLWKSNV